MKLLIVILAICAAGYVAKHWQEIKEQHTLFSSPEAPALIVYGSKSNLESLTLQAALTREGIAFQKRDVDREANANELTAKLARLGRPGGHVSLPVAEVNGVLIVGASIDQVNKRLK